jgi:flagellin
MDREPDKEVGAFGCEIKEEAPTMGLRINQNITAFNAYRNLTVSDGQLAKSLEKLSSGFRINRAADDAAGLVISENLRSQVGGLRVATRNAQDGVSVVQTAEGALTEVHSMLQRMRDLVVQANNGSTDAAGKSAIQSEITALTSEITRVAQSTRFGSNVLLSGATTSLTFVVGSTGADTIAVTFTNMQSANLGATSFISWVDVAATTAQSLTLQLAEIDAAISDVSTVRGTLGAVQNRFEHTIANLGVAVENLAASESRIRDADMAAEMVQYTRNQIMLQAGTAMLAQANSSPQSVLQLFQ